MRSATRAPVNLRGPRRRPPRRHASGAGAVDAPLRRRPRRPRTAPSASRRGGRAAGRADRERMGGAPRRHRLKAGRFVPIDEHRPRRPASRQAHAQRRRRGRSASVGRCATNAPAVLDHHPGWGDGASITSSRPDRLRRRMRGGLGARRERPRRSPTGPGARRPTSSSVRLAHPGLAVSVAVEPGGRARRRSSAPEPEG